MSTAIDRVNQIRKRILAGEDVTETEMRDVITQIRGEREAPSRASAKKKTPPKPLDLNALFGDKEKKE